MSVAADIGRSWLAPRRVMAGLLAAGPREDRALAFLMIACALVFVSEWPRILRDDGPVPTEARFGGALMAWFGLMPLLLYGLAAASHLLARALGGRGAFWSARLALFWSLLAAAPAWLLAAALGSVAPGPAAELAGALALALFLWLWAGSLWQAEAGHAPA